MSACEDSACPAGPAGAGAGTGSTPVSTEPPPPQQPAVEFGWVPATAVRSLMEEVGNFRARAAAIELLHAAVQDVGGPTEAAAVLPTLSAFLAFLLRLVADANFKIAISAMTVLEDLVLRLGNSTQPYLGTLAAALIERLGDNVQMVRRASAHSLATLARVLGPSPVLAALGGALAHSEWRVREESVNAYIAALLGHPKEKFDYPACVRALAGAVGDTSPRVATAALEALAVLHARLGALLQGLMTAVGVPDAAKRRVAERIAASPQLGLPTLDAQGHVQHQEHARPPSAHRPKPAAAPVAPAAACAAGASSSQPSSSFAAEPQAVGPSPTVTAGAVAAAAPGPQPAGRSVAGMDPQPESSSFSAVHSSQSWSPGAIASTACQFSGIGGGPAGQWPAAAATAAGRGQAAAAAAAAAAVAAFGGVESSSGSYSWGGSDMAAAGAACSSMLAFGSSVVPAPAAADGSCEEEVERSDGSLLKWVRPGGRRPPQQSFTGPSRGSAAGAVSSASAAAAAAPFDASGSGTGKQQATGQGSIHSFLRSTKSTPTSLYSSGAGLAPAAAAVPARSLSHAAPGAAPSSALGGAYNADLHSSVRNWQLQQAGGDSSNPLAAVSGGGEEAASQQRPAAQDGGLGVEARSDSLLQWRLPPRAASSRQAGAGLAPPPPPQQAGAAAPVPPSAQPLPPRVGSASLMGSLSSFTKRLFGSDAAGAGLAGQQDGKQQSVPQAGAPGWSIPAARPQEEPAAPQHPSPLPARPGLAVIIPPEPAAQGAGEEQAGSPQSPGKAGDRLSRLKQMAEQRRVWSAPIAAQVQAQQQLVRAEGGLWGMLGGSNPSGGLEPGAASSASLDGSPGPRPGLQALKARARTARLTGSGSTGLAGGIGSGVGGGSSSQYSMEDVNDVFGPDQPVSSPAPVWSPLKAGTASPPKLSVLTRSSASGSKQWPGSPTGSGTPSGRSPSWRGAGFFDAASACSSPKAAPPGTAGGSGSFSPSADLSPLAQPEAALQQALAALQQAAASQKRELDWQSQFEALRAARRLARHHPAVLAPVLHSLVLVAAPVIDALRSTLSRLAIMVFQELAENLGPALDPELDAFVPLLLKRAGQVSVAGRDNFLAVEADRALAAVVTNAGEAKVAAALLACLASRSPDVRAKAGTHLDACLQQHGADLVSAAGSAAMVSRLLRAAVGLLDEGSLDARTAGKRMLWELRHLLDSSAAGGSGGEDFRRALARLDCKTDKVWDVFEAGRMPAAPARLSSASLRSGAADASSSGALAAAAGGRSPAQPAILSTTSVLVAPPGTGAASTGASGSGVAMPVGGGLQAGSCSLKSGSSVTVSPSRRQPGAGATRGRAAGDAAAAGGTAAKQRPSSGRTSGACTAASGTAAGPAPAAPAPSLAGLDLELQQQLEAAGHQMGSSDWKQRLEGIEALQRAVQQASEVWPPEAQMWLAEVLAQRVVDVNLRCQQQALALLNAVLGSAAERLAPAAPALLPAMCKALDSGNPSARQAAADAVDAAVRAWPAAGHLPPLMEALGSPSGAARSKALLLDQLVSFAPLLWQGQPALLKRHVLPALFALLMAERRPELRQMVQGALAVLAKTMGQELAAAATAALPPAQQQVVAAIVAAQRGAT